MILLIVSLVAGLFYLISGKVQYKKVVYLEGAKARIAGLILLAPVGLMTIVVVGGLIYESTGNVADAKAFDETLNALTSGLVRNGFMIGLAYIYYYSVSRETKDRKGCLTYWLIFAAALAVLLIYFFLPNIHSSSNWLTSIIIGFSVLQLISITGIWSWKKWGVFGYAILNLISPIIAFLNTESVLQAFISLIQTLSLLLVLYLLVRPKWQFFE